MQTKTKIGIGILIIVVLLVGSILIGGGSELFQGKFGKFSAKNISKQISRQPKKKMAKVQGIYLNESADNLIKKVTDLTKKVQKNSSFENSLIEIKQDIQKYKNQMEKVASKEESELLGHSFDHARFADKIAFIEKMQRLPITLDSFSNLLVQFQKDIKKEKIKLSGSDIKKIASLDNRVNEIRPITKELDSSNTSKKISLLRDEALAFFLAKRKQLAYTANLNINGLIREIIYLLRFDFPEEIISIDTIPDPVFYPFRDPQQTNIRAAVCVIRWEDGMGSFNITNMRTAMADVENYYDEVSYGNVSFGDVQYVNAEEIWDGPLPESLMDETEVAIELCDSSIDFNSTNALIIYPSISVTPGYSGTAGGGTFITEEGKVKIGTIHVGNYFMKTNVLDGHFNSGLLSHEFGHVPFGLSHAKALDCGNAVFGELPGECEIVEYGNPVDVMGVSSGKGHFNGWSKRLAGWVNVGAVMEDGEYQLGALEVPMGAPQVLRIPFRGSPVCIEYRKPIGYDDYFSLDPRPGRTTPGSIPDDGSLFINLCPMGDNAFYYRRSTLHMDTTPSSLPSYNDTRDAYIPLGGYFNNEELGFSITFDRILKGNMAEVNINLDEDRIDPFPDLFTMVSFTDSSCNPGIFVEVRNISELDIDRNFRVEITAFNEDGTSIILEADDIQGLGAGEQLSYIFDDAYATYSRMEVVVDSEYRVDEMSEVNNTSSASFGYLC